LIGTRFCLSAIEMLAKRGTGIRARGPSLRSASSEGDFPLHKRVTD
jgi:hypothetical protein